MRVFAVVLAGYALWAQSPSELFRKAPPEVDAGLRARIQGFMQAHVDGKFRQAEAFVAEDTKDFFYASNKPKYLGFEIKSIEYSDNFTKAKAMIIAETVIMAPGFAGKPMKVPFASYWKVEGKDWFWYVDQARLRQTPFGVGKPGEGRGGELPVLPSSEEALKILWSQVKLDRNAVALRPGGREQVVISNAMEGGIKLSLEGGAPAGLSVKIDREDVPAKGKAVLTVAASPAWKGAAGSLSIRVLPSNQLLTVRIAAAK